MSAITLPDASLWWAPQGRIKFLACADGGYPVAYGLEARDTFRRVHRAWVCADCAAAVVDYDPEGPHPTDLWWAEDTHTITAEVVWEGPPIECDGCGAPIPSAYGDPYEGIPGCADD